MDATRYLIVGGGMTGDAAAEGIREHDADGSIGLVGAEPHPPYNRPPLSKALWQGKDESSIWRGTRGARRRPAASAAASSRSTSTRGTATDDAGEAYGYERLLLATGGRRARFPAADGRRLLPDARRLPAAARARPQRARPCVVVGGGFIGSEIAAALAAERARR